MFLTDHCSLTPVLMFWFCLAIVAVSFWALFAGYLLVNRRRMRYLKDEEAAPEFLQPPVVIIIAVRNEEAHLAAALESVGRLHYSHFRLLLINDRSTDGTAQIMENFACRHSHVTVIHIDRLPAGWLGKNHALYKGYQSSAEPWIFFTDADVVFAPDTLAKAMHCCLEEGLDHLTLLPAVRSRSEWLNSALATFSLMLEARQRPWAVRNPRSGASLGVGAFNLVKRTAYEQAGTHQAIALRPDDDLKLAERIKASGGVPEALYGQGQIGLEWYPSVREFIRGLMKNTFSVFDYQLWKVVVVGIFPTLFFFVLPLPLLILFGGATERLLALLLLALQTLIFVAQSGYRTRWWYSLLIPYAGALMVYIMLRSALLTMKQKGIFWRDSFYPLEELRKGIRD